tara:strand:- start:1800 stop:2255 length:456 start_codon:yes stop_codon:yes gene_type:complete
MIKKISFIILLLNLLNHCEYKPVYSNQNKVDYKIIITSFTGDKDINNLISTTLKRNSKENSSKILNISFETIYSKDTLARNTAGTITDYQANVITKFTIKKENSSENFSVNEKFNFQKMTDKYEEKNYEQTIKKNLANSISQKLILRLAIN